MKSLIPCSLVFLAAPLSLPSSAQAQETRLAVQDLSHRLYSPRSGTDTFLLDRTGNTLHTWSSSYPSGNTIWLREDGKLLRAIRTGTTAPGSQFGGAGGGAEILDLLGRQVWEYRYDTGGVYAHHDVQDMPNGNVLLLAWEAFSDTDAIAAGRNPATISGSAFFPDHIIEVLPTGPTSGQIVWEWHVWDHLVQDFDSQRANFGVVADHPELVDINYPPTRMAGDWNHSNSMDYDADLDLILISANFQEEIWIIDHSTTTAEAAGSTGGQHGKGGDLLFRWGNPEAYGRGTSAEQQLFIQHAARWIHPGRPGAGNVILFNNQAPSGSEVIELVLPTDPNGQFILPAGGTYGPAAPVWSYSDPGNFQSNIMSSAERLQNGNTLICSSLQGRIFEIDSAGTNLWEIGVAPEIQNVTFHVSSVQRTAWRDRDSVSIAGGGQVHFGLLAGSEHAGASYLLAGSLSGSSPGFLLQGFTIPLNIDSYLRYTMRVLSNPYHTGNFGLLDGVGGAQSTLHFPPGLSMSLAGRTLHYAYLVADTSPLVMRAVSNAMAISIVP